MMKDNNGRMMWSGKNSAGPDNRHPRKTVFGSMGIILALVVLLTLFISSTVYAATDDLISEDGYIWGEISISSVDENVTNGYTWGETSLWIGGGIITTYGYAWGE
ncbi:MAG: hypothetical protein E4H27_00435 [Anaerolineales bacterium]|nr:MAG: hypothetical protein E4H27_00435 [Anaerolineales bacterium]